MLSFWEKQSLLQYDIIIVGAGIVGLSTAISLKESNPALRVLVLERAILPTGASTKNAGFACIGSLTEILDDLKTMSEDEVLQLVELRLKGLQRLRARLGDENISYAENGSWELISNKPDELAAIDKLQSINKLLQPVLKGEAFTGCTYSSKKTEFGFNEQQVSYLIKNNYEGELQTGKMMRNLIDLCTSRGIEIKTGCKVRTIDQTADGVQVVLTASTLEGEMEFSANKVAVCTNAFSNTLFPELDIQPGRGLILITKFIQNLPFKGIYHFDKGYYYFRRIENRVLFGGGRNIDFTGENTTEFAVNEKIKADLVSKLSTTILPGRTFEIDYFWTGIMAFGANKYPILKKHSNNVWLGVRMGGMGIAIGSEVGHKLATMMLEA